jgi:hypothetical protein
VRLDLLSLLAALAVALLATACTDPDTSATGPAATSTTSTVPSTTTTTEPPSTTSTTSGSAPTTTTTTTAAPADSEPGLTEDTMRIAVVADVATGDVADELFVSSWYAIEAWAANVNDAGGLAGREVEIEFVDTALFGHAEAMAEVCSGDIFALVGSRALFDSDGLDVLTADDCSLPDFPAAASTPERQASATTFVSNPLTGDLVLVGADRYLAERNPDAARRASTFFVDLEPVIIATERRVESSTSVGFEYIYGPTVAFDEDYVPHAEAMAAEGVRSVIWEADGPRLGELLAALEETDDEVQLVECGQSCYEPAFLEQFAELAEGVSVVLTTVPFEEIERNPELAEYVEWLAETQPESIADADGVGAWAAGRLFEAAVNSAIGKGTDEYDPGLLTRQGVVLAAEGIKFWTARGLHGLANPGERKPSPCFLIVTLVDGVWARSHPIEEGTFDCAADNLFELVETIDLGEGEEEDELPPEED